MLERPSANSADLNDEEQCAYYGRAGGCLITGNEDGIKHCPMGILYALRHLGYTIPAQPDAGWIRETGPSYGDDRESAAHASDSTTTSRSATRRL